VAMPINAALSGVVVYEGGRWSGHMRRRYFGNGSQADGDFLYRY